MIRIKYNLLALKMMKDLRKTFRLEVILEIKDFLPAPKEQKIYEKKLLDKELIRKK
jgi:hypothetical protein